MAAIDGATRRAWTYTAGMKLGELECFLEVARQGNMTVAAKVLHVAQSTVSERVQELETQLGVPLFERSARARRVELTPAGKQLQAAALRVVNVAEDLRARTKSGRSRPQPIRIGVNGPVAHAWLGGWLTRLRAEQPELAFDLKVGTTDELDSLMVGGGLDLAIGTRGFGYRAIQRRELKGQEMAFVGTSARHDKPEYSLRELAGEGLITFQARSIVQQQLLELLRAEGLEHSRVDTVSSTLVILRLVEAGAGVGTLPRLLVEREKNPRLRILPCSAELNPVPLWLSWRTQRNKAVSDAMVTLLAVLDELTPNKPPSPRRSARR
jgi:DNA-binding transcriptional LysR family regulator